MNSKIDDVGMTVVKNCAGIPSLAAPQGEAAKGRAAEKTALNDFLNKLVELGFGHSPHFGRLGVTGVSEFKTSASNVASLTCTILSLIVCSSGCSGLSRAFRVIGAVIIPPATPGTTGL